MTLWLYLLIALIFLTFDAWICIVLHYRFRLIGGAIAAMLWPILIFSILSCAVLCTRHWPKFKIDIGRHAHTRKEQA